MPSADCPLLSAIRADFLALAASPIDGPASRLDGIDAEHLAAARPFVDRAADHLAAADARHYALLGLGEPTSSGAIAARVPQLAAFGHERHAAALMIAAAHLAARGVSGPVLSAAVEVAEAAAGLATSASRKAGGPRHVPTADTADRLDGHRALNAARARGRLAYAYFGDLRRPTLRAAERAIQLMVDTLAAAQEADAREAWNLGRMLRRAHREARTMADDAISSALSP